MRFASILLLVALAGCSAVPSVSRPSVPAQRPATGAAPPSFPATDPTPPSTGFIAPQVMREAGLEGLIGQDARGVQRLFGQPRLDTPEGDARKLQYVGRQCVLDVFLYPLRPGSDPVATHVEARRRSDGEDMGRAQCVRELRR